MRATRALEPPVAIEACSEVALVTSCHWGDDGGVWRGPDAQLVGDSVVIGLPPQDYVLSDVPQRAAIAGAAATEVRTLVIDNPSWDCTVDVVQLLGCR